MVQAACCLCLSCPDKSTAFCAVFERTLCNGFRWWAWLASASAKRPQRRGWALRARFIVHDANQLPFAFPQVRFHRPNRRARAFRDLRRCQFEPVQGSQDQGENSPRSHITRPCCRSHQRHAPFQPVRCTPPVPRGALPPAWPARCVRPGILSGCPLRPLSASRRLRRDSRYR